MNFNPRPYILDLCSKAEAKDSSRATGGVSAGYSADCWMRDFKAFVDAKSAAGSVDQCNHTFAGWDDMTGCPASCDCAVGWCRCRLNPVEARVERDCFIQHWKVKGDGTALKFCFQYQVAAVQRGGVRHLQRRRRGDRPRVPARDRGRGVLEHKHSTDGDSTPIPYILHICMSMGHREQALDRRYIDEPSPHVCTSIHP